MRHQRKRGASSSELFQPDTPPMQDSDRDDDEPTTPLTPVRTSMDGAVPVLRCEGRDERGWFILVVSPMEGPEAVRKIIKIKLHGNKLELVQQTDEMKVYVNPDKEGCDEWAVGNERLLVGTPKRQSRTEAITKRGG